MSHAAAIPEAIHSSAAVRTARALLLVEAWAVTASYERWSRSWHGIAIAAFALSTALLGAGVTDCMPLLESLAGMAACLTAGMAGFAGAAWCAARARHWDDVAGETAMLIQIRARRSELERCTLDIREVRHCS